MAHSRRKNDVTTKGGLSPTRSVRRIFYRELKVYDVEMEEDSEQILLSPTESELICPVDKPFLNIVGSLEKRNMSLKGRKSGSLGGFPSSPKAVSSLMNVVPSSSTAVRESKGKSKKQAADKHKLDLLEDPFSFQISEFDSSDNIILRLPTKGTVGKSSPDTLANLVRLAMRRGLLGPYFRGLAYEDPSKLMMWQSEFMDAQSTGSEPLIDALLDYVKKSVARNQGKGAHTKGSATRSGSKSNRKGGRSNESDTRVKSWSLLKSKKSAGQTRPPLYLSNSMEEYGGVVTEYPSNRLTYGQGKDWLDPDYMRRRMRAGRGGAEWISPGFIEALKEEGRASRPKASGPPLRKPHLLPEIPGVEYDRTLFDGWDFGRTLGPKEISKLPGLSERANLMIQRRPPKIPIDNYVKPTENSRVTCAEYLAKYAIHELLQFLMYVIVRERPGKPIDFMIEMTQIINRLIKIRESTEVRMDEMERAREMRQPV